MGFHLRKSYNLGGVKLNLSNSGVGFSTGIKGLRVGIDGKGRGYISGGKGILRYRKYMTSGKNNEKDTDKKLCANYNMPNELKYSTPGSRVFLLVFWLIVLIPLLFVFPIYCIIAALLVYNYCFSKKIKISESVNNAFNLYNSGNLSSAVEILKDTRIQLNKEHLKNYIDETILYWLISSNNYQDALNYINDNALNNKSIQLITIYRNLEQWEPLINLIQQNYSQDKLNNDPVLTATLADAFLNLNQNEVALNVLVQSGLSNKRKMNDDMCVYRYILGKCYEATGDKKKAVKQYEKIYAYNVNYQDVKTKLESFTNDKNKN